MNKAQMRAYLTYTLVSLDNEKEPGAYSQKVEELYSKISAVPPDGDYWAAVKEKTLGGWKKIFDMYGSMLESNYEMLLKYPNRKVYQKRTLSKRSTSAITTLFGDIIKHSTLPENELQEAAKPEQMNNI
jgi:hypothetical protein